MENLNAATIPLFGRHLIEASAGTGKTFNITRLYLRFLLERELTVEQILVMTFTKDATQEIKGRIDDTLRETLANWQALITSDPFFGAIAEKVPSDKAQWLLKRALLSLDDAAIFTIHGFCKRVLSQHAFQSGIVFNANLDSDGREILLQATQDWYRVKAKQDQQAFINMSAQWQTPDKFVQRFGSALQSNREVEVLSPEEVQQQYVRLVRQVESDLYHNETLIREALIDSKTGSEHSKREQELRALMQWLQQSIELGEPPQTPLPTSFFSGTRFSRSPHKESLKTAFESINLLKKQLTAYDEKVARAHAYLLAQQGIYDIRQRVIDAKDQTNTLSFDDLIHQLARVLCGQGNTLAQTLFEQFPVALVDEFQDTDTGQFSILEQLYFAQEQAGLYLIGDPKQAIYGFRGGDIFTYLQARDAVQHQWVMDTNWRSSAEMITAYNRVFYGNNLNDEPKPVFGFGIDYAPVNARPKATTQTFDVNAENKALQFVYIDVKDEKGKVSQQARAQLAQWCANEIGRLLSQQKQQSQQTIQAQDIAILVRDSAEAADIQQALSANGLAAVYLSDRSDIYESEQASQLLTILNGIAHCESEREFSKALTTRLLGFDAASYHALQQDGQQWQHLYFTFSQLKQDWLQKGFISMALKLLHQHIQFSAEDKDRELTNVLHLFELLQQASGHHKTPDALLYFFKQHIENPSLANESELRLESDDNLIRIVTQHSSKGLEYPIVFIPFATRHKDPLRFGNQQVSLLSYHDEHGQAKVSIDGSDEAKRRMADEAYAESIRLLYVAITRAEQRCYVLAAEFDRFHQSPLGLTLHWQPEQDIQQSLQQIRDELPNAIGLQSVAADITAETTCELATAQQDASVSQFSSKIERDWWLSSFSAIAKNLRHGGVSAPDRDGEQLAPIEEGLTNLLRFALRKGAQAGNLLHDVLEHTDFAHPEWEKNSQWPLTRFGDLGVGFNNEDLFVWLDEVISTPLAPEKSDKQTLALNQLTVAQTLKESEFYFPMTQASSGQLARLLSEFRGAQVNLPHYTKLKGMMHGFIDLVFEFQGKYYVCDYKSTHLGDHFEHYHFKAMKRNIEQNYYDLQFLIYSLALHRYLKLSKPDYEPRKHFGGVYYLYLRGMTTQPQHQGAGVYYQAIAESVLDQLDTLFSQQELVEEMRDVD